MIYTKETKNLNIIVFILFMVIFLIGSDTFLISPLIPMLSKSFNVNVTEASLLIIAYSLPYAICGFAFGPLSDKIGRKTMLKWGILTFSIFTILCGLSWNFPSLFIFRIFSGIAAATSSQVWALIGDMVPFEKRGRVMGIVTAALSMSQILGVPIGAFVAGVSGWRSSFYDIGILGIIVFLMIIIGFPVVESSSQNTSVSFSEVCNSLKQVLINKRALSGLFVTLFMAFGSLGMYSFLGAWLSDSFNMNVTSIARIIIVVGIGNLIGNLTGGYLSDVFGKNRIVKIGLSILAISLIFLPFAHFNIGVAIFTILIWLVSAGASLPSLNSIVSELVPSLRGTVMALNSSFMYIGATIGVIIEGFSLNKFGYKGIGFVSGGAVIIAVIIISLIKQHSEAKVYTTFEKI